MKYYPILITFLSIFWFLLGCFLGRTSINSPEKQEVCFSEDTLNLAKVIFSECSICPVSEQLLIGSVPINRVKDGRWGSTLEQVIYSPSQFYQANGGKNWKTDEKCYKIAQFLLTFGSINSEPLYFFQTYEKNFTKKLTIIIKEKYHIFAK